jgi:hypothetical protein
MFPLSSGVVEVILTAPALCSYSSSSETDCSCLLAVIAATGVMITARQREQSVSVPRLGFLEEIPEPPCSVG